MRLLWSTNSDFISQKTAFFIVTAVKTSDLTKSVRCHTPEDNFRYSRRYEMYKFMFLKTYHANYSRVIRYPFIDLCHTPRDVM
jgi:hypothetical protein